MCILSTPVYPQHTRLTFDLTACCKADTLNYTPVCSCSCMHMSLRDSPPLMRSHETLQACCQRLTSSALGMAAAIQSAQSATACQLTTSACMDLAGDAM